MTPATLHAHLSHARTVRGTPLPSGTGPLAIVLFRASTDLGAAREALARLSELSLPTVAIALDGAQDLAAVHAAAGQLAAPVLSDPFGTLRRRLGLGRDSAVYLATDELGLVRFDLHRATPRALFATVFDAAWRAEPTAAK